MRVYDLSRPEGETGGPIRIAVLGSCRITDPFDDLCKAGIIEKVWAHEGSAVFTLGEAQQLIDFTDSRRDIPDWLRPYIFPHPYLAPVPDGAQRRILASVDYFIVEASDLTQYRFRDFFFHATCFVNELLTKHGGSLLPWYRLVGQGKPVPDSVIDDALAKLAIADETERRQVEVLLREARIEDMTQETVTAAVRRLMEANSAQWIFVPHFLVPGAAPTSMADRLAMADYLNAAAAETGARCYDPTPLVARAGRKVALDKDGQDIFHYAENFRINVGYALLDTIRGVAPDPPRAIESAAANQRTRRPAWRSAKIINEKLVALHRARVARMGVDLSGLHAYYKSFLDEGELVGEDEVEIAEAVTRMLPPFRRYHVLRAGLGEIAFLLADLGCDTVAFDGSHSRYRAARAGARVLTRVRKWPGGRIKVVHDDLPPPPEDGATLCIATQGAIYVPEGQEEEAFDRIAQYDAVLFSPRLFIGQRDEVGDQEQLIESLRSRGFDTIRDLRAYRAVLCARGDVFNPCWAERAAANRPQHRATRSETMGPLRLLFGSRFR